MRQSENRPHTPAGPRLVLDQHGGRHAGHRSRPHPADAHAGDGWVREAYREQAAECLNLAMLARRHGPVD